MFCGWSSCVSLGLLSGGVTGLFSGGAGGTVRMCRLSTLIAECEGAWKQYLKFKF